MADIFLPTLHTFAMDNEFTGSCGALRFRIVPVVKMRTRKEVDMENSRIDVEFWHGALCYEKSTIEGQGSFPMSEQGRQEMKQWLENKV